MLCFCDIRRKEDTYDNGGFSDHFKFTQVLQIFLIEVNHESLLVSIENFSQVVSHLS